MAIIPASIQKPGKKKKMNPKKIPLAPSCQLNRFQYDGYFISQYIISAERTITKTITITASNVFI